MDEENVVHIYNGIFFIHEEKIMSMQENIYKWNCHIKQIKSVLDGKYQVFPHLLVLGITNI